MANKTINQIENTVTSVAGGDYLPIWDTSAGKTGKITRSNLVSGLQSTLTFDNYPTRNSSNPAKSGGIFSANAVIMASSTTITNAPTIASGSIIRVMFTSAITGSDTTTALSLSYNGTSYPVKVGKQGSLSNFVASYVNSTYTYLQAYTTLELAFDGTQFIIIGNPVVLSSSDYTIYADGSLTQVIEVDFSNSNIYGVIDVSFPFRFSNTKYSISIATLTNTQVTYPAAIIDISINVISRSINALALCGKYVQINQGDTTISASSKYGGLARLYLTGN